VEMVINLIFTPTNLQMWAW